MKIEETLRRERLGNLPLSKPTCVQSGTSLRDALDVMRPEGIGAILVCKKDRLVGIFTERDVLNKVFEPGVDVRQPIDRFMTSEPSVLTPDDTLGDAVRLMTERGHRHIPLQDARGKRAGMITARQIVNYIAEHFPAEVVNLPPSPDQSFSAPEGA